MLLSRPVTGHNDEALERKARAMERRLRSPYVSPTRKRELRADLARLQRRYAKPLWVSEYFRQIEYEAEPRKTVEKGTYCYEKHGPLK